MFNPADPYTCTHQDTSNTNPNHTLWTISSGTSMVYPAHSHRTHPLEMVFHPLAHAHTALHWIVFPWMSVQFYSSIFLTPMKSHKSGLYRLVCWGFLVWWGLWGRRWGRVGSRCRRRWWASEGRFIGVGCRWCWQRFASLWPCRRCPMSVQSCHTSWFHSSNPSQPPSDYSYTFSPFPSSTRRTSPRETPNYTTTHPHHSAHNTIATYSYDYLI